MSSPLGHRNTDEQRRENPFFLVVHPGKTAYAPLFSNTSRESFYLPSYNESDSKPVLMDHFAYCMDNHITVEAVFNLKYLQQDRETVLAISQSVLHATIGEETVLNEMPSDPHVHTIIAVFRFRKGCNEPIQQVVIHHDISNASYSFQPSILPDYSEKRYYLSMCTSVSKSNVDLVKMWLYYYYYHGVEHVVIMANERYHQWMNDLQTFVAQGVLDIVDMEYPNHKPFCEQQVGLQVCNRHLRYASQFVIYNDIDEFFLPLNTSERVVDVLSRYDSLHPLANAFRVFLIMIINHRFQMDSPLVTRKCTVGRLRMIHPFIATDTISRRGEQKS